MPAAYWMVMSRFLCIPFLLGGYILYQAVVHRKGWPALKQEAGVTLFFSTVYLLLYWALT